MAPRTRQAQRRPRARRPRPAPRVARCTATSCASGSPACSARSTRSPTARSTRASRTSSPAAGSSRTATADAAPRACRASARGSSTASPRRARSTSRPSSPTPGPDTWEDDRFGVRLAFFGRTEASVRLRILEGRRSRLEERLDALRSSLARTRERLDSYTLELQQHGLESVEREVRWLDELIASERDAAPPARHESGPVGAAGSTPRPGPATSRPPTVFERGIPMGSVRVAIVGVGNCASSLVQGVEYYKDADPAAKVPGLMHVQFGDYHVRDVEFVAAFDVDAKKVGLDLADAIGASENNTIKICDVPPTGVTVQRGHTLDGLGKYYREMITESDEEPVDVVAALREAAGRRPRLLPARRLRAGREVLRAVRHRRQGRVRQRAARSSSPAPRSGRKKFTRRRRPDRRRRHQVARSARPSRTACWRSCSRTAASPSTAPTSSTSAATWTS